MPKTKVTDDVPFWDSLVAELGDPRPYEPGEISASYAPTDEPFIDLDYFDDLLYEIATQAEEAMTSVDAHRDVANELMDEIWVWPEAARELHNMTETTTQFATVGALLVNEI